MARDESVTREPIDAIKTEEPTEDSTNSSPPGMNTLDIILAPSVLENAINSMPMQSALGLDSILMKIKSKSIQHCLEGFRLMTPNNQKLLI